MPCIQPAPLKFELTNHRYVGDRNCTVLTSSRKSKSARAGRHLLVKIHPFEELFVHCLLSFPTKGTVKSSFKAKRKTGQGFFDVS